MDFFQHQESARRKTGLLVFYFIVAVVLIVLLVYAILEACSPSRVRAMRPGCTRASLSGTPGSSEGSRF